jgi:hypothetical protein
MDQPLPVDCPPGEVNVQLVVIVKMCEFLAVVGKDAEAVLPAWQAAMFHSQFPNSIDQLAAQICLSRASLGFPILAIFA